MGDRIIRSAEVLEMLGVSRIYLRRLIKDGKFPKPLKNFFHGERRPRLAWKESTIEKWLDSRS